MWNIALFYCMSNQICYAVCRLRNCTRNCAATFAVRETKIRHINVNNRKDR